MPHISSSNAIATGIQKRDPLSETFGLNGDVQQECTNGHRRHTRRECIKKMRVQTSGGWDPDEIS